MPVWWKISAQKPRPIDRKIGRSLLLSSAASCCWTAEAESLEIVDLMDSQRCRVVMIEGVSASCVRGGVVDIMDLADFSVAATCEKCKCKKERRSFGSRKRKRGGGVYIMYIKGHIV